MTDATVKQEDNSSSYDVIDSDILFALALHVLVISSFVLFALYPTEPQKKPLKRIEINMITAQELAKLQRPEAPIKPTPKPTPKTPKPTEPTPVKKTPAPVKPIVPKIVPPTPEPPKPIAPKKAPPPKPEPKKSTPKAKPKASPKPSKPKPSTVTENPFAPTASKRNHQQKKAAPKIDRVELVRHQLSSRELDRYIAMMQAAVQKHWTVPRGLPAGVRNPLVRVELQRNGDIRRITILETSGIQSLDQTLVAAIRAAAPFTLPREQYAVFKSNDIRFHPRER